MFLFRHFYYFSVTLDLHFAGVLPSWHITFLSSTSVECSFILLRTRDLWLTNFWHLPRCTFFVGKLFFCFTAVLLFHVSAETLEWSVGIKSRVCLYSLLAIWMGDRGVEPTNTRFGDYSAVQGSVRFASVMIVKKRVKICKAASSLSQREINPLINRWQLTGKHLKTLICCEWTCFCL